MSRVAWAALLAVAAGANGQGGSPRWVVDLEKPGIAVSPLLYGLFFEEINWAGDGGLYAELIRNRSFEDSANPDHWVFVGDPKVIEEGGARYLRLTTGPLKGLASNHGWGGMGVRLGDRYRLQLRFRARKGKSVNVTLRDPKGKAASRSQSFEGTGDWKEVIYSIRATRSTASGRLVIGTSSKSETDLDWVSLFPENAHGVFRKDLFGALKDLRPGFVRFPGGCWVEGDTMATAYRWKTTIGPWPQRKTVPNLWGYRSTNGLGYHEYLELCENLKAEPLFVVKCGMSHREVVPLDKMDEFVQDALDAVEYANGSVTSKWGAVRAANGHPKTFNLRFVEIGNENGGPAYEERYRLLYRALKQRYPEVQLIANVWGGTPRTTPLEIIDEHYYSNPAWFLANEGRYDSYDRKGPKVYVGEFAVTSGVGEGNLRGALAEAAFAMGMERNADHVVMSSYAPLLAHPAGKAWNPDLIYFDSTRVAPTPSYWVQQMLASNRPDRIAPGSQLSFPSTRDAFPVGGIGVGTWRTQAEFKDITLTDTTTGRPIEVQKWTVEKGDWLQPQPGVWHQTSMAEGSRLWTEAGGLRSYRLDLKARKTGGDEGFLISVGQKDKDNFLWLNLGGWGNTLNAIEHSQGGGKSRLAERPGKIETGKWFDLSIEYGPERIRASVDGRLLFDEKPAERKTLFTLAGIRGKETILKVLNVSASEQPVEISLQGRASTFDLEGEVLNNPDDNAANPLGGPKKVTPRALPKKSVPKDWTYLAPPHSLTILRLKPRP